MAYPETINLPFNSEIISSRFVQLKPNAPSELGYGYWAFVQGETLLLSEENLYLGDLPEALMGNAAPILFGQWDGEPVRVCALPKDLMLPAGLRAVHWTELPDQLATLYGMARQVVYWEKLSRHCSRCGCGEMGLISGSWGKRCLGCGHEHYPHIHPCVIVLVTRGDEFLLARKPEWAPGRYSLVAGFVDFGESLEECVVREVMEETGLKVDGIRYVGSQNWPFPSQMMAGFVASHASGEIVLDGAELEDAAWFSRDRMPPALPPPRSIARWIIDNFALGKGGGEKK